MPQLTPSLFERRRRRIRARGAAISAAIQQSKSMGDLRADGDAVDAGGRNTRSPAAFSRSSSTVSLGGGSNGVLGQDRRHGSSAFQRPAPGLRTAKSEGCCYCPVKPMGCRSF